MRFCFIILTWVTFVVAPAVALAAGTGVAKVRSVVRVDRRTGKLVRSVVVHPKVVAPKVITPKVVAGSTAPQPRDAALPLPEIIESTARRYDVDPLLVHSVIQVESNYNPYAVSPKGAEGLMQLMPATARRFGVRNSFEVAENIEGGVRYLKYLQSLFGDDRLALAAYNAGEGAVMKYNNRIPPYPETVDYVYKVGQKWGKARAAQKQSQQSEVAAESEVRAEPVHRPVEAYIDENGKLHLSTK